MSRRSERTSSHDIGIADSLAYRHNINMAKKSAGILLYRRAAASIEVFLVHPGGPFFAKKDIGSWSCPKGEYTDDDPLSAAKREFREETGFEVGGDFMPLTPVKLSGGKTISAWAVEGTCDATAVRSNTFRMEWPPKSGKQQEFPEVDRADWFSIVQARAKLSPGQVPLVDELCRSLGISIPDNPAATSSAPPLPPKSSRDDQGSLF